MCCRLSWSKRKNRSWQAAEAEADADGEMAGSGNGVRLLLAAKEVAGRSRGRALTPFCLTRDTKRSRPRKRVGNPILSQGGARWRHAPEDDGKERAVNRISKQAQTSRTAM